MVVKTVEEMMADAREKWVVDVRKKEDFDRDHYPDSEHIFFDEFWEHRDEFPKFIKEDML